ncbi:3889_t:CDS:2 [Acaulospora colombiana]|uniref:3889_t:CDS:1 n=1 Tax=Acaulospora colombiana TaxID=27376 RepID=A0ACA9MSH5_9GLOM|nr:3889_t:CDS:2 [Acaulospora colombiana]
MEDNHSSTAQFKKFLAQYAYSPDKNHLSAERVTSHGDKTRERSKPKFAKIKNRKREVLDNSPTPTVKTSVSSNPDIIGFNLKVLFVGINPGKRSAQVGHHFAHHSNHFYPCLIESGFTNGEIINYEDDITLPKRFNIGIINVVGRDTRSSADLSTTELRNGIPSVIKKVKLYRPEFLCFIGKCGFDAFEVVYRTHDTKKSQGYGLQLLKIPWEDDDDPGQNEKNEERSTKIFCIPSTSARVKHYQKLDKLKYFKELNKLVNYEKKEGFTADGF